MTFKRIISKVKGKYLHRFKPLKYVQLVGVNFPRGGVHLYGNISWGTEPWLITIGNNVHITEGVKFITHDGGHFYIDILFLTLKLQSQ